MPNITYEELLNAGAHFGHQKRKWNPAMAPYIFAERNNTHIIDLRKTLVKIDEAVAVAKQIAANGKKILFVGTKKQIQEPVEKMAKSVGMPYVTVRWPGGMLTNFPTIRKAVKKMASIDKMKEDGTYDNLSKREKLQIERQRANLERNLGSIADMVRLPAALFVVDVIKEKIAVREATRLGIPVFAVVDTNADPKPIDYVIPANDDSVEGVELILSAVCSAIAEGIQEYKMKETPATEEEATEEGEKPERTRTNRRSRTGARRERTATKGVEVDAQTAQATQEQEAAMAEATAKQEDQATDKTEAGEANN